MASPASSLDLERLPHVHTGHQGMLTPVVLMKTAPCNNHHAGERPWCRGLGMGKGQRGPNGHLPRFVRCRTACWFGIEIDMLVALNTHCVAGLASQVPTLPTTDRVGLVSDAFALAIGGYVQRHIHGSVRS